MTSHAGIDSNVININFLRRDTSQLYGLARNRKSRMRSDDWGDSWNAVTDAEYDDAGSQVRAPVNVSPAAHV